MADKQTDRQTGYPSIDKPWLKYYDSEFLKMPIPAMNIYSYLKLMTKDYMALTAMTYFGKEISYKELLEHIDEAAKVMIKFGVKANDRVMYLMPNIPETAYLLYGGARIGAVADYIDPRPDSVDLNISAQKVLSMIKEEHVRFLVVLDQCYVSMIRPIEEELKKLEIEQVILVNASDSMDRKAKRYYICEAFDFYGVSAIKKNIIKEKNVAKVVEEAKRNSKLRLFNYSDLIDSSKKVKISDTPYKKDQLAVIVHTSGTSSSRPKPIPLTHDNLNFYVHQTFGANMPMDVGDRALHVLPYFAAFGIVDVTHAGLCHGNNLIQIPEFSPYVFGKIVKKYRPQIIIGAPSWFLALSRDPELQKADLSFMKMTTYGGDSMDANDEVEVNLFLESHHSRCILTKGHGMSETCGCASFATNDYNMLSSVGIPMPLTTYAIVDPDTKEMMRFGDGVHYLEGELIISSGATTLGVLDGQTIVPRKEYNGDSYIFTRDIARMDENGGITFLARSDRSITRFDGYKIKPYEVENVIKDFSEVKYCVISPVYDTGKFGNVTVADIVLKDDRVPSRNEQVNLIDKLIQKQFINNPDVSARQIPVWFRFRKNIPLTANSKVDYNSLAKESLIGNEIFVNIEETNISIDRITVS